MFLQCPSGLCSTCLCSLGQAPLFNFLIRGLCEALNSSDKATNMGVIGTLVWIHCPARLQLLHWAVRTVTALHSLRPSLQSIKPPRPLLWMSEKLNQDKTFLSITDTQFLSIAFHLNCIEKTGSTRLLLSNNSLCVMLCSSWSCCCAVMATNRETEDLHRASEVCVGWEGRGRMLCVVVTLF